MQRYRKLAALAGVVLVAALAGCHQSPAPVPSESADSAVSGPEAKPGIAVSGARLVLPVIAGRPAAAYFTVTNGGPDAATLAGVHITGAGKAQMHKTEGGTMAQVDTLEIAPGSKLEFAPGGLHVMVFDLAPKLTAGGTSELTLTFADGDKISTPLTIEAMGGAAASGGHDMSGMEGMSEHDMQGMQH